MLYVITEIGFIAVTVIFYSLLLLEFTAALPKTTLPRHQQKKFLTLFVAFIAAWTAAVTALSMAGIFRRFDIFPFNLGPFLFIPLITIIIFTFSKSVREILTQLNPARLIRLQIFRVFVEILIWLLFIQNLLPVQMTFEGQNFDIVAGITAPLIAYLALRKKISKKVLILWNLAGLGLLINIVAVAILSMPTPMPTPARHFMNDPANTIVTQFPISLLPTFLVPLAYMLHFLSLRQLTLIKDIPARNP